MKMTLTIGRIDFELEEISGQAFLLVCEKCQREADFKARETEVEGAVGIGWEVKLEPDFLVGVCISIARSHAAVKHG